MRGETVADRLNRFCAEADHAIVTAGLQQASNSDLLNIQKMTPEVRRTLKKSLRKGPQEGSQAADLVVEIERNVRLIFPDPSRKYHRITAKIALPWQRRNGCLSREIKARKWLASHEALVQTPKLLRYDTKKLQWLEEEYIAASKTVSDSDKAKLFLDRYAVRLYATATRSRPISRLLRRLQISMSQLVDVLGETGNEIPGLDEGATWPVSLLHGDLGANNILVDQGGGILLVDWERLATGPVAWDLKRLFQHQPDLVHDVLRALSGPSDISPASQVHVVLAVELIRYRRTGFIPAYVLSWRVGNDTALGTSQLLSHFFGRPMGGMSHRQRVKQVRRIARIMDDQFTVPGTKIRFGWDAIIGLIPGIGDGMTSAASLVIVYHAWRLGIPWFVLFRMLGNIGIDFIFGLAPIAGDAFDVVWKANKQNAMLLKQYCQN